ncbi:MAG TPA: DUF6386 family protein [Opitutaceae bacterium]|nr:DUF6386 family protein [Opitutaceae bacterium]
MAVERHPYAETRFKTDTAALAIFDPTCLRHRSTDACDWSSSEADEVAEANAGNVLFIGLGADAVYSCKAFRDREPHHVPAQCRRALLKSEIGCFYVGAAEQVPAEGVGWSTVHGGVLVTAPAGTWEVQIYAEAPSSIVVRIRKVSGEARNAFSHGVVLDETAG